MVNTITLGHVNAMISANSTETVARITNSSAVVQLILVRGNVVNGIHLGRVTAMIIVRPRETVAQIMKRSAVRVPLMPRFCLMLIMDKVFRVSDRKMEIDSS